MPLVAAPAPRIFLVCVLAIVFGYPEVLGTGTFCGWFGIAFIVFSYEVATVTVPASPMAASLLGKLLSPKGLYTPTGFQPHCVSLD